MATIPSIDTGESGAVALAPPVRPCLDHIVTEDDTPVDNMFSEKQQRLLTEPLYSSWDAGRPFLATANVGLCRGRSRIGIPSGCVGAIATVRSFQQAPSAPTANANAPSTNAFGRNS
jgi:hypothetical protein